jgi:hypothetical protein
MYSPLHPGRFLTLLLVCFLLGVALSELSHQVRAIVRYVVK